MDAQTPANAVDLVGFLSSIDERGRQLLDGGHIYLRVGDITLAAIEQGALANRAFHAASEMNYLARIPTTPACQAITRASKFIAGKPSYLPLFTPSGHEIFLVDAALLKCALGQEELPPPPGPPATLVKEFTAAAPAATATVPAANTSTDISPQALSVRIGAILAASYRPSAFVFPMHGTKFRAIIEPNKERMRGLKGFTKKDLAYRPFPHFPGLLSDTAQKLISKGYICLTNSPSRSGNNNTIYIMREAEATLAYQAAPEHAPAPKTIIAVEPVQHFESEYVLAQRLSELSKSPGHMHFTLENPDKPYIAVPTLAQFTTNLDMIRHTIGIIDPPRFHPLSDLLRAKWRYIGEGMGIRLSFLPNKGSERSVFIMEKDEAVVIRLLQAIKEALGESARNSIRRKKPLDALIHKT